MNQPPRISLIGISGYGEIHLQALQKLQASGECSLVAATVVNRSKLESKCRNLESKDCRVFDEYKSMLESLHDQADLCVIPTGIHLHCPMTIDAYQAGCHVYVEKPASGSLADIEAMEGVQTQLEKRTFVGFQHLYLSSFREIKRRLLNGEFGELQCIKVLGAWPRPDYYYTRNEWAGRLAIKDRIVYDSPANNAFAHYLMAALYFSADSLNKVARVEQFTAELYRAQAIESFDTLTAQLEADTGVHIYYSVTHSCKKTIPPVIELKCSGSRIIWEADKGFFIESSRERLPASDTHATQLEVYRSIFESLRQGTPAGCDLAMAREHTRFINLLHEQCLIRDIDESMLETSDGEYGGSQISIRGIEQMLTDCYNGELMLSERLYNCV